MLGYLDFMVLSKHIMEIFPDEDDITADIYSATKSLSYLILGDPQQTNRPSPCTQKKFAIALRNTCEDLLQGPELKDINQEALSRIEDLAHQAVQWKINADANERGDNDCTKCNVTFSSQDELFAHKQEEHSSDSISSGSNTPDLRHEERDEKYCDTCHDTFAGSYRAHMDAHHGPKSEGGDTKARKKQYNLNIEKPSLNLTKPGNRMGRKLGSKNKKSLESVSNNEVKKTLPKPKPFNFFAKQIKQEEDAEEAIDLVLDDILPQPKCSLKQHIKKETEPLAVVKDEPDIQEDTIDVKDEVKSQASDHSSGYESPSEHDSSDHDEDWKPEVKGKQRAKARTYGSRETSTYRAISKPPLDDEQKPGTYNIINISEQNMFNIQAMNSLFKPQNLSQLKALTNKIAANNAAKSAAKSAVTQYQEIKPRPVEGVTHFSNLQNIKPKPPPIMCQAATKVLIQDLINLDLLTDKSAGSNQAKPRVIKTEDHQNTSDLTLPELKIIAFPHTSSEVLVEKSVGEQSQRMLDNVNCQTKGLFEKLEQSGPAE